MGMITPDQIRAFRDEAAAAGDAEAYSTAFEALDGDLDALRLVMRWIEDARAMDDGEHQGEG
jgi:hypothetical protein